MPRSNEWPDWMTAELRRLKALGQSNTQIAGQLGVKRGAIAGKWNRLCGYKHPPKQKSEHYRRLHVVNSDSWDNKLFEPWEKRKLRLQRERSRYHEEQSKIGA